MILRSLIFDAGHFLIVPKKQNPLPMTLALRLLLWLCLGPGSLALAQNRPNIIHIVADDVGYDDLGCYGARDIRTPHLDQLAREGKRFTQFYAPHGTCTPTRASLLTGRYAARVNGGAGLPVLWPDAQTGLDPQQEVVLPKLLQQRGYRTGLFGKWHLGHLPAYLPLQQGFDEFFGIPYPNDMGPERTANTGSRGFPPIPLLRQNQKVKDLTNPELAELPAQFVREAARFIREQAKAGRPFYLHYANIETHTPWFLPLGFGGTSQAKAYGDAVEYFDLTVGMLMRVLQELKLEENTLVVVTSDNGPIRHRAYGQPDLEWIYGRYATVDSARGRRLRGGKMSERFEGGTRVNCLARWKGVIPANTLNHDLVAGFDWFATFAELAGAPLPTDRPLDGRSLVGLLKAPTEFTDFRRLFFGISPAGEVMAVRYQNWKLCLPTKPHRWEDPIDRPLLFDLATDGSETTDLSARHPAIVQKLQQVAAKCREHLRLHQPINDREAVF
jgi:arylsulfatase A